MKEDFKILYNIAVANDTEMLMEAISDLYNKFFKLEDTNYQNRWKVDYAMSFIEEHTKGHLPPILSPSKLQDALNALKLEGDYEVMKPKIYASLKGSKRQFVAKIDE